MSNSIQKSRIPIKSRSSLPPEVGRHLIDLKNRISRARVLATFRNRADHRFGTGSPLPRLAQGCHYLEFDVGRAHPNDFRTRGRRRFVVELHEASRTVREIYYTEDHYAKGRFVRIL